jgi:hypothetical protein
MASSEICKRFIDSLYLKKITILLGCSPDDLEIKKLNITINDCSKCDVKYKICDKGLCEDNVSLYTTMIRKLAPLTNYCMGHDPSCDELMSPYVACYNENNAFAVFEGIKISDFIRACDVACYNIHEICKLKLTHNNFITKNFISKIFEGEIKSNILKRKKFWSEIDEGLRRLFVMPVNIRKNMNLPGSQSITQHGIEIRMMHGHQLRNLIQSDKYSVLPIKEDVLLFGHYHLQFILFRYGTWIMCTGHFLIYKTTRKIGFLSHIGSPMLTAISGVPFFTLIRYKEQ